MKGLTDKPKIYRTKYTRELAGNSQKYLPQTHEEREDASEWRNTISPGEGCIDSKVRRYRSPFCKPTGRCDADHLCNLAHKVHLSHACLLGSNVLETMYVFLDFCEAMREKRRINSAKYRKYILNSSCRLTRERFYFRSICHTRSSPSACLFDPPKRLMSSPRGALRS